MLIYFTMQRISNTGRQSKQRWISKMITDTKEALKIQEDNTNL